MNTRQLISSRYRQFQLCRIVLVAFVALWIACHVFSNTETAQNSNEDTVTVEELVSLLLKL